MENTIKLGLNVPLFIASLLSIGAGTFVGMVGVWGYSAQKLVVPEWVKVGHAHLGWWSVLILLAALIVPGLPFAGWFRRFLVVVSFLCPSAWILLGQLTHYYLGVEFAKWFMPVFEILLFLGLIGTLLTAAGVKISFITAGAEPKPGRYDILSSTDVDRRVFLLPTLVSTVGIIVGFILTATFKLTHEPITPAALVQLHDHLVLISASSVIALLTLRILNVSKNLFKTSIRIMEIALPLIAVGLIAFNLLGLHSLVWNVPAAIYYVLPILAFLAALGLLPKASAEELPYTPAIRVSLAFVYALIIILVAQGAYIALVWDTSPNITVTFKQPEGVSYPGPYPATFLGTAPVKNTPRGLENAHLSPDSWSHVAALWLITLALVGSTIFVEKLKKPGLLYLFCVTIPMAPAFNMVGRYLAWWPDLPAGAPAGIGALLYAGHPVKGFNIISLFIIGLAILYIMSRTTGGTKQ